MNWRIYLGWRSGELRGGHGSPRAAAGRRAANVASSPRVLVRIVGPLRSRAFLCREASTTDYSRQYRRGRPDTRKSRSRLRRLPDQGSIWRRPPHVWGTYKAHSQRSPPGNSTPPDRHAGPYAPARRARAGAAMSAVKLCKHGHPRTPANVDRWGHCKACDRERQRERWRTNPAYRERRLEQMRDRHYSDDPRIHRLILAQRVRADIKARERRIAKRREARAERPDFEIPIDVEAIRKSAMGEGRRT